VRFATGTMEVRWERPTATSDSERSKSRVEMLSWTGLLGDPCKTTTLSCATSTEREVNCLGAALEPSPWKSEPDQGRPST
jgi:hypothetical protein